MAIKGFGHQLGKEGRHTIVAASSAFAPPASRRGDTITIRALADAQRVRPARREFPHARRHQIAQHAIPQRGDDAERLATRPDSFVLRPQRRPVRRCRSDR